MMRQKIRDVEEARSNAGDVRRKRGVGRKKEEGGGRKKEEGGTHTDAPPENRNRALGEEGGALREAGSGEEREGGDEGVRKKCPPPPPLQHVAEEKRLREREAEEKRLRERERGFKCRQDQSLDEFALDRPRSVRSFSAPTYPPPRALSPFSLCVSVSACVSVCVSVCVCVFVCVCVLCLAVFVFCACLCIGGRERKARRATHASKTCNAKP